MTTPTSHFDRREARKSLLPIYDALYKAYPLHQDYGGGFNAFLDAVEEGADPDHLLTKAQSYSRNVDPTKLKWVPHLRNWIKGRRYDDEDLFTDQRVATREWFVDAYRRADAAAVERVYGFLYSHPPIPDDIQDVDAWHRDHRRLWVGQIARHILHGEDLPA